jgi:ribose transport system substrate-binding protein
MEPVPRSAGDVGHRDSHRRSGTWERRQPARGRRTAAVLLGLAVTGVAAGCGSSGSGTTGASGDGSSSASSGKQYRVGYVLPDLSNPLEAATIKGAEAAAAKNNIKLLVKGSNDAAAQSNMVLSYVGAQVDALVVHAVDGKAIAPAVKAANDANIPVVAEQNPVPGKTATYVGANNREAGASIGKAIVDYCGTKNPCNLAIIAGNLASPSGMEEDAGVRDVVKDHPNVKIVASQATNYDAAKALNVATNILTAHPDVHYLYAWWDQGAEAALQAVKEKGVLGKVKIAGYGGTCLNLQDLLDGNIHDEAVFFSEIQGGMAIDAAKKAIDGESQPALNHAPYINLTTDQARAVLDGSVKPPAEVAQSLSDSLRQASADKCPK